MSCLSRICTSHIHVLGHFKWSLNNSEMVTYPIYTAKLYKMLKAVIYFLTAKHNMEQLNNLWFKCFSNKDPLSKVMSAKNPCIQKYVEIKTNASLCRKLSKVKSELI